MIFWHCRGIIWIYAIVWATYLCAIVGTWLLYATIRRIYAIIWAIHGFHHKDYGCFRHYWEYLRICVVVQVKYGTCQYMEFGISSHCWEYLKSVSLFGQNIDACQHRKFFASCHYWEDLEILDRYLGNESCANIESFIIFRSRWEYLKIWMCHCPGNMWMSS